MDGVLCDFVHSSLALHNRIDLLDDWPLGERRIPQVLGISKSSFWAKVDEMGHEFWSQMPPFDWTQDLVSLVEEHAPYTILSSPSLNANCPTGKINWLRNHIHGSFRDYLFGHQKHFCAKPDVVLIDDTDYNIDSFREHGGRAILFPQPWNANHAISDRLGYVKSELAKFNAELLAQT